MTAGAHTKEELRVDDGTDQGQRLSGTTRRGLVLLVAALALGILGDALLRAGPPGLNAFLWILSLAAVYLVLDKRGVLTQSTESAREPGPAQGRWMLAPALLLAAGFLWRDSPALQLLDVLGLGLTLGLASAYARGGDLRRAGILDYGLNVALAGLQTAVGLVPLLAWDIKWNQLPRDSRRDRALALMRGLAVALPLLVLFGSLFTAADAVFAHLVNRTLDVNLDNLASHVLLALFWAWLAAGWLRAAALGKSAPDLALGRPAGLVVGGIETGVVLGSLNALFLAFVLVQFRYFFGGAALVQATTGLTYAEYARHGFFELVGVSALLLPLLLLGHWLQPQDRPAQGRLFRWLAAALVAQLFVIMASAVQRMLLYQREYGLTELRLYTTAFMLWLSLLFFWFLATVLRRRQERFAFGVLVSGMVLLLALHALNPDGLIVRANVARLAAGRTFDAAYAASLSADGVPALVTALPLLNEADCRTVTASLLERWSPPRKSDWRTWNWGRARAHAETERSAPLRCSARAPWFDNG